MTSSDVCQLQEQVETVKIADALIEYIIELSTATRNAEDLQVGISTRGGLALTQVAKATAMLAGRDYCVPEDVIANVLPVCAHRIVSRAYMQDGDTNATRRIMQQVLETIPIPA
ncbi:MAG: hypothetical protein MK073_03775 [Phycisphaerales bacterium]|nr:hypothetical protein [Phycisphaerales bacterium]